MIGRAYMFINGLIVWVVHVPHNNEPSHVHFVIIKFYYTMQQYNLRIIYNRWMERDVVHICYLFVLIQIDYTNMGSYIDLSIYGVAIDEKTFNRHVSYMTCVFAKIVQ